MRPKERRETGQTDLLRFRLDAIIDLGHPLVKLTRSIDFRFLEERIRSVYEDKPGRPPLPTRLMAGLAILKHTCDLSDEVLCERWLRTPTISSSAVRSSSSTGWLVFDCSSLTRCRQRMGEKRLQALLQESLSVATKTDAILAFVWFGSIKKAIAPPATASRADRLLKSWWHAARRDGFAFSAPQAPANIINAFLKRDFRRIQHFKSSGFGFAVQVLSPDQHPRIRQLWLSSLFAKPIHPHCMVTMHQQSTTKAEVSMSSFAK
jgi:Transposase domain (DUF772)